jgi:predicted ABC-type ATPase
VPDLFIITGSNGAGKSSVGPDFLPQQIRDDYAVFDGDLLFVKKQRELFPEVTRSPKEAKRMAFQYVVDTFESLVEAALIKNENFVYEGHFTNHATWDVPKRFKAAGYTLHLLFLGLMSPDLSQSRVTGRVAKGGHFVDRATIEANFVGNLEMLNLNFDIINHLTIIDTSEYRYATIATINSGSIVSAIPAAELPRWFIDYLPSITKLIS